MDTSIALPRGWETSPLAEELRTYQSHKDDLIKQSPNKFVLIKDDQIIGTFNQEEDAYNAGYQQFRRAAFLVKQVQIQDKTYYVGGSSALVLDDENDHASS